MTLSRDTVLDHSGKKVLLYSGGMDSYILSKFIDSDVLLYCDIGINISEAEKYWLSLQHGREKKVLIDDRFKLGDIQRLTGFVTPLRLTIMNFIASYYGDEIYGACLKGEKFLANTEEFERQASELLTYMYSEPSYSTTPKKISIHSPFKDFLKGDIVDRYLKEIPDASLDTLAKNTFSCREPSYHNGLCGKCLDCSFKWAILMSRGYDMRGMFDTRSKPSNDTLRMMVSKHEELARTPLGSVYDETTISFMRDFVERVY